jgi:16S rRNA (adenine1518-N6/adenine1519-N6)-dimethyltransferase
VAKKSLGQNFLKSAKALNDIVSAPDISPTDTVLEIGPGKGALTEKLLETGAKVVAVEYDADLIPILSEKFAPHITQGSLVLVREDIIEFDPSAYRLKPGAYKLVGNIPYYITGAIIRKFLESDYQPSSMTLLVQKEVAERIVARDGKASILSVSVQAYGEPHYVGKVSARYFTPEPKVDSAIIFIDQISKKNFKDVSEENFFQVVKLAFGQKRKTIMKNLSENLGNKDDLLTIFSKLGISDKARAEDLSFGTMLALAKELFPQKAKRK